MTFLVIIICVHNGMQGHLMNWTCVPRRSNETAKVGLHPSDDEVDDDSTWPIQGIVYNIGFLLSKPKSGVFSEKGKNLQSLHYMYRFCN